MAQRHLKTWRAHYGLSQADLAQRLGVGREWVAKIESMDETPSRSLAERIWRVTSAEPFEICGIPPSWWNND